MLPNIKLHIEVEESSQKKENKISTSITYSQLVVSVKLIAKAILASGRYLTNSQPYNKFLSSLGTQVKQKSRIGDSFAQSCFGTDESF